MRDILSCKNECLEEDRGTLWVEMDTFLHFILYRVAAIVTPGHTKYNYIVCRRWDSFYKRLSKKWSN